MKKGYVIVVDWHFRGDESVDILGVMHTDYGKAKESFDEHVLKEKETSWISDTNADNLEIDESANSFIARHKYRDDYTEIYIREVIIK